MKTTEILARLADERRRVNPASAFGGPRPSDEFRAGIFADLLAAEDFHHLTSGHPVSPDRFHVYRREATSPTGCRLAASFEKGTPFRKVLARAGKAICAGGQMSGATP